MEGIVTKALLEIHEKRRSKAESVIERLLVSDELTKTALRALEAANECIECSSTKILKFASEDRKKLFDSLVNEKGFLQRLPIAASIFVKRHVDPNFQTFTKVDEKVREITFTCYIPEKIIEEVYNCMP